MGTLMGIDWLPRLLQITDSLFPTGAYAHSNGLEEMVRLGIVTNEVTLLFYLQNFIIPILEDCELPYVRFCYEAAHRTDVSSLVKLNLEISAWKVPVETRECSLKLGGRRFAMLHELFPHVLFDQILQITEEIPPQFHHIVVAALQATACDIPLNATLVCYSYQMLSGACNAALKLIRIGQEGIQRTLEIAVRDLDLRVKRSLLVSRESAGAFNPLFDIACMRHAGANERLFIS